MRHKGPTRTYVDLPDGRRAAITTTPFEVSHRKVEGAVEITVSRFMKVELVEANATQSQSEVTDLEELPQGRGLNQAGA